MIGLAFDIRIRMATRREIDAYPEANVSFEESAAVYVGGELVGFTDEYGTGTPVMDGITQHRLEVLVNAATDLYTERLELKDGMDLRGDGAGRGPGAAPDGEAAG
jgi:hypothetical protein